jgi:solute carrier family 13 (sodium-dependent dicarboxylate transporter), member 2/3/5
MKKYYDQLVQIMPDPGSLAFFVFLVLSVTAVHMFIGSSVTLIVYITVAIHFLLPFHHATMIIGARSNHFYSRCFFSMG